MWATRTSSGAAADRPAATTPRSETVSPAAAHTHWRRAAVGTTRQTRCTPYARRMVIDWAPLIYVDTHAGPKWPPASSSVTAPSRSSNSSLHQRARRSWPAADGGRRSRASGARLFRPACPAARQLSPPVRRPGRLRAPELLRAGPTRRQLGRVEPRRGEQVPRAARAPVTAAHRDDRGALRARPPGVVTVAAGPV